MRKNSKSCKLIVTLIIRHLNVFLKTISKKTLKTKICLLLQTVNASQAGAGNLEIIVSVNGCNVPNYVQSEGNAKFRVNFKPREAAPHSLSVRFNGEPIPGQIQCFSRPSLFMFQGIFKGSLNM